MPKIRWNPQEKDFWYSNQGIYLVQVYKHSFKVAKPWRWEVKVEVGKGGMGLVKGGYAVTIRGAKTKATRTAQKLIEGKCPHCLGTGRLR